MSGYSGGGRSMIEAYEAGTAPSFELYGLSLEHKHIPELHRYSGLTRRPIFIPSVGNFRQGMLVSIPLHLDELPGKPCLRDLELTLDKHYRGSELISIVQEPGASMTRLAAETLNGTDRLEIFVFGKADLRQAVLVARLDNLGKGAAGAAVQNIRLMLGLDAGRRRKGSGARGGPRHSVNMHGRGGDSDRSAGLVREAERDRHAGKQRRNAEPICASSAAASRPAVPTTRSSSAERRRATTWPERKRHHEIGDHAMVELHGRHILEDVEIPGRELAEPRRARSGRPSEARYCRYGQPSDPATRAPSPACRKISPNKIAAKRRSARVTVCKRTR